MLPVVRTLVSYPDNYRQMSRCVDARAKLQEHTTTQCLSDRPVAMTLLENHLEQISLSSAAIAELP